MAFAQKVKLNKFIRHEEMGIFQIEYAVNKLAILNANSQQRGIREN
ncbi:hypothetical protein ACTHOQ_00680 [Solibacillus silvestris]